MAPDILTEAAFGAVLAGSLARKAKQQSTAGWVAGVIKKTWWPFTIVLVLAGISVLIATINIAGGFWVTQRMLKMFRRD